MKYLVSITAHAEAEIASALAFIAADSPSDARSWLMDLNRRMKRLARFPRRCRMAPEARSGEELRQFVAGLFRVIFLIEQDHIHVITVRRTAQLPHKRRQLQRRFPKGR